MDIPKNNMFFFQTPENSLDLHKFNGWLDAKPEVEKFLDNALVKGIPIVQIIHGYSTSHTPAYINTYKNQLRKYLKNCEYTEHIKPVRDGDYDTGKEGATLIEFK